MKVWLILEHHHGKRIAIFRRPWTGDFIPAIGDFLLDGSESDTIAAKVEDRTLLLSEDNSRVKEILIAIKSGFDDPITEDFIASLVREGWELSDNI